MKPTLEAGLKFEMDYEVPEGKTVPHLYPEAPEFQQMPRVLATGFMVGLIEWACLRALIPYLDWPREQSVGTHVNLSHVAATPPGLRVRVQATVTAVDGPRVEFAVRAEDEQELISEGTHQRHVIDVERFNRRLASKSAGPR